MATDRIERLRFYQRQYLGAVDFTDQQAYHRDMRRRHNLAHHTWGIEVGLELFERAAASGVESWMQPGFATDGFGREIVALRPHRLDPAQLQVLSAGLHEVWIAYDETEAGRPAEGYELCDEGQFGRLRETFRIVVEPESPTHARIVVAGREVDEPPLADQGVLVIPPDKSVPHQELPEGDERVWLVPLGKVEWDGSAFVPLAPEDQPEKRADQLAKRAQGRRHAGSVAAELLAPAGKVRLRDRATPSDPARDTGDLAGVEGSLRVDGLLTARDSVHLHGGRLAFRDDQGQASPDLEIYRQQGEGIRMRLGDGSNGPRKLSVGIDAGTEQAPAFESKVTMDDEGQVETKGSVDVSGHVRLNERLEIRDPSGGIDTDILWIERARRGADQNDLRLVIGDNEGGDDRLVVGPRVAGNVNAKLTVANDGTTRIAGEALIAGWATVGAGGNGRLRSRHVDGKDFLSDNNDDLFLNWDTGKRVWIGRTQTPASLTVTGDLSVGGDFSVGGDLSVGGDISVGGDFTVDGDLAVSGSQNLLSVFQERHVARVPARNTPATWTVDHPNQFSQVYAAFAVFQGFSLWPQVPAQGTPTDFNVWGHDPYPWKMPQHAFVRVDDSQLDYTSGVAYCTLAEPNLPGEENNSILFTVVVLGRP
jgi:hypothetical protein